jgi:hypothetical protein
MKRNLVTRIAYLVLVAAVAMGLAQVVEAASSNIDPANRWAWGKDVGWFNFKDTNGGVTVYSDHLEGYAWAENIGWIRLGSAGGNGTPYYKNTTKDDYGVIRDSSGNLSGYAWGTNVGWINFRPTDGGVTIDPRTGAFDGFAWSENVGWIHFKGTGPVTYGVFTRWLDIRLYLPFVK